MLDVILSGGREKALRRRHPWVLSGAVARVEGAAEPGAYARVLSSGGEVLGYGHYSPRSALRVRMLAFGKETVDEEAVLTEAIRRAIAHRSDAGLFGETEALRLVNSEGDGLPGLIADRYGDTVIVRLTTPGMDRVRPIIAGALRGHSGAASALERADAPAARREGFAASEGALWGAPPDRVVFRERDREYVVDVRSGQKTGFYLDQRCSRDRVQALARGRRVLDLFCYSGSFSVAAARGGARAITAVDSSEGALRLARENLERSGADLVPNVLRADAFEFVRSTEEEFDLLVIDPPPLARTRRDVTRATRAYKDVFLHALRRAAPGAYAFVFACSHHIGPDLFRKVVFGASLDAGRRLTVLEELTAPADHPVSLDHPEGRYLSGLLVRVEELG